MPELSACASPSNNINNTRSSSNLLYLGFDFGERRTGIAVGQTHTATATAVVTLTSRNGRPDWGAIGALIDEWQPSGLVVGQTARGNARIAKFCRRLEHRFNLEVHVVNEDYTSTAANEHLRRNPVTRADIDQTAAVIILEAWLGRQRAHTT